MVTSFRSSSQEPLTEAEEYSIWSNRICSLFSQPYHELHRSIYERAGGDGEPRISRSDFREAHENDCNVDTESELPWCFLARMMHATTAAQPTLEERQRMEVGHSNSSTASCGNEFMEDDSDRYSSVSQHLYMSENEVGCRLASQLRERQSPGRTGNEVSPALPKTFGSEKQRIVGDAKVELQQAKLMEEMTDLLLHLRRKNELSAQLGRQLRETQYLLSFCQGYEPC